jgi:outer membrane lipoprotein carrier protein
MPHRASVASGLLLLLLLPGASTRAARPPVQEVVSNVQAFYQKTKDLKGKFKQVFTDTLYNRQRTHYGYLYVKKPGMMRWNYVKPERKSFIADGKELWVHEPEDKQAFRNPLSTQNLSTGLTFLLGTGNLAKEFEAAYSDEKLGSPEELVIKLTPRRPTAQYRYILLVVRPGDFSVSESMVVSKNSKNHLIFSALEINTKIPRSRFVFKPGADVRVIDGSKLQRP